MASRRCFRGAAVVGRVELVGVELVGSSSSGSVSSASASRASADWVSFALVRQVAPGDELLSGWLASQSPPARTSLSTSSVDTQ